MSIPSNISDIARQVQNGELRARQVAEAALAQAASNRDLNAFLYLSPESILKAADALDERRLRGEVLGPLAGVPIGIKDALCTLDAPTTCASKMLLRADAPIPAENPTTHGWRAPYDATVVARLRQAGALIFGKTNMDEFAMGSSNENSAFGPVKNPVDRARIPGGSSGGSAAVVAAGITPCSLGSDTGGSIRQPAGLTGIVGVKPSYGRVSRYGLIAFASSLDQVGPFAQDVRGAARVLEAISGVDPADSTSADLPVGAYEAACGRDIRGLRIGVPEEYFGEGLDAGVRERVEEAIAALERDGATIVPLRMPHTNYGIATYYVLATAECSSNLARFDGVRFGLRQEAPGATLGQMYGASRNAGFGAEVKRRILLGTYVLSAGYYDAYYLKAQKVRTLVRQDFENAFAKVDVLATPTSPTAAFKIGAKIEDPLQMYLADVYTLPASLAGVCALSVPCRPLAATPSQPPLPVGLQLLGPAFAEERLFQVAARWEALRTALGPLAS
ncbi:MAG: Asp-tRNA(Asn)/Glu-tRNA(Gln) amidotransferase subunit GatA [Polyangiaceae bacterium]|nr:Asp-tRNA(Asn)/Glu-tRNA(Gln) amidotransferase subunit GatA [Polyangiaceae bacterium]